MPTAMRSSLIAAGLCAGLGAAMAAGEQGPGKPSTWSDPPARSTEAPKPPEAAGKPALPAAASAAQQKQGERHAAKAATRRERLAASRAERRAAQLAEKEHRPRPVTASRRAAPVVSVKPGGPPVVYRTYPAYSAATVPPDEEDERFDRLSTAVPSGYLVMRRRTIEYPDGRTIRIYRPAEDGFAD
ncbi:hypothetical protein [Methylobacterium aerolatum]|uniref:Pyruvate/2-oxoglutarate dehydrogenase complex dihydrolipoamide acyltransferase (E2) component n=1 Tax=Methylobacterium aerolatum TaxID=418708 RepID=A0ABU0HU80_9HYPH|nr:hypothetical protein [Methylobacterium aerolatum]MDQ0445879.1 pyruvate/2-oxoglutarate dehydrogenase complex dihydrolipoamide acyltransferase (E2) component [Methylobacterium aerolatum]GJD35861.1 hypothetical protein FMGBMHLM_2774 [Methylobacterium aerolatum]